MAKCEHERTHVGFVYDVREWYRGGGEKNEDEDEDARVREGRLCGKGGRDTRGKPGPAESTKHDTGQGSTGWISRRGGGDA